MYNSFMYEIEMKASIEEPDVIRRRLQSRSEFGGQFYKSDLYFSSASGVTFRLRREESSGRSEALYRVTVKEKQLAEGCEVNREVEFDVSNTEAFRQFALMTGAVELIRKVKRGELFLLDGVNLELCEIEGLGWFLEMEMLTESEESSVHDQCRLKLQQLLSLFAIDADQVVTEYYIDLLRAKNKKPSLT